MSKFIFKTSLFLAILLLPIFTFAANFTKTSGLLSSLKELIEKAIPVLFSLALLMFFWGVVKYIRSAGDKEESKRIMWWGIIALFVMSSVWGLVYFIGDSLDLGGEYSVKVPNIEM